MHTASMPCVSPSPFTMHKVCQLNVLRSVTKTAIDVYITSTLWFELTIRICACYMIRVFNCVTN